MTNSNSIRNWLTYLRIHTSSLTQAGAMLGPLLLGVRDFPTILLYALWGLIFHAWGFTDNNLQDYEYDLKDPAKQHFALIKGDIPIYRAKLANILLFIVTLVLGLGLSYPLNEHPAAFAFLILAIVSGMLYNRTCKKSLLAPIYIAISFTALPLFTYFTQTSTFGLPMILVGAYTILLMLFQIGFEGYLKDIESDPVNLLRSCGAYIRDGHLYLGKQIYLWVALKAATILIGYKILIASQSDMFAELLFYMLSTGVFIVFNSLASGNFDNKSVAKNAARMEIITYFSLIIVLQGMFGWLITATLILYPMIWFMVFNFATWKTVMRPKV